MTDSNGGDSRSRILADIRRSLGRDGPVDNETRRRLAERDATTPAQATPAIQGDPIERFLNKVEASGATTNRVRDPSDVASAVAAFLAEHDIAPRLVTSGHEIVENAPWPPHFEVESRAARGDDRAAVTGVVAALAETGSVVLESGADSPTTLNFLPDNHICVVEADQIGMHLESVWQRAGGSQGAESVRDSASSTNDDEPSMPRAINFITGPSKTADVEQVLQHGAHGPRRLHVIVVG